MTGIGVVGYGYWGPNVVRNMYELIDGHLIAVCDGQEDRLAQVRKRYPAVATMRYYGELLAHPAIDAVAIATPLSTHYDLTMQALRAGKHVLIEKPLAASSEEALRLVHEAEKRKLVLMVDHTFVYTGAVRKVAELVASGELGQLYYYDSVRVNLGLFRYDVNVLWDLAVHDLSIMDYVLPVQPCAVSAVGMRHVPNGPENIAYLTLFFDNCLIAHINVNWLAPVKVRSTLIGGSQKMIVYDDLEPSEKIKVYDKGITVTNGNSSTVCQPQFDYRSGDMWAPQLSTTEALRTASAHFVRCIEHGEKPLTDGHAGLRIVRILEAATRSIQNRGQLVELTPEKASV